MKKILKSSLTPSSSMLNQLYSNFCSNNYESSVVFFLKNQGTENSQINFSKMSIDILNWFNNNAKNSFADINLNYDSLINNGLRLQIVSSNGNVAFDTIQCDGSSEYYIPGKNTYNNYSTGIIGNNQNTQLYNIASQLSKDGVFFQNSFDENNNSIFTLSVRQGISPENPYGLIIISLNNNIVISNNDEWDTSENILHYKKDSKKYSVILTGFSLTHTENYAGFNSMYSINNIKNPEEDSKSIVYFNYYNNYIYTNLVNVAKIIYGSEGNNYNNLNNLSSDSFNNIPSIRIPLNADYWLNGSGTGSTINTNMNGEPMTSDQYQNMIKAMVYYLMNPNKSVSGREDYVSNGCVIIFDLHWNFSYGLCQGSTQIDTSVPTTTPTQQNAMAAASNSIKFWDSMCQIFGIDKNGDEFQKTTCKISKNNDSTKDGGDKYILTKEMKKNIFFELYNEPYVDRVKKNQDDIEIYNDYTNDFKLYIQGSQYYLNQPIYDLENGLTYDIVGMGTLYNNIRITNNCSNIIILSGAESYGCYFGDNYVTGKKPNNFIYNDYVDENGNERCYNCWTKLNESIKNGSIPIMDISAKLTGKLYDKDPDGLKSVIANIHPYSNKYTKFPGYMYNTTNTDVTKWPNNGQQDSKEGNPNLCNFLQALLRGSNPYYIDIDPTAPYKASLSDCTKFQISFPLIFSEFGMYNLPWINSNSYSYTESYKENPNSVSQGTPDDWTGIQSTISTTYYHGRIVDQYGNETNLPMIVGYFENLKSFGVSYTIWSLVPSYPLNQKYVLQVNYGPDTESNNKKQLRLLKDNDMNNIEEGQNGFDMDFCFQKYYLNKKIIIE